MLLNWRSPVKFGQGLWFVAGSVCALTLMQLSMQQFTVTKIGSNLDIGTWTYELMPCEKSDRNTNGPSMVQSFNGDALAEILPRKTPKEIRRWGCDRMETPFIFVHIGKAGGGSVRARIAASSFNFTKDKSSDVDGSFYPIGNRSLARYCDSCLPNHRPSFDVTYEGTIKCHASTPIGHAIGCPTALFRLANFSQKIQGECQLHSDTCHLVYCGHNMFGSEISWLPPAMLRNWWSTYWSGPEDAVLEMWSKLAWNQIWCDSKNLSRPWSKKDYERLYPSCSVPLQRKADARAALSVARKLGLETDITDWSSVYASMPVLRATLIRDPFTWPISKFAWHTNKTDSYVCDQPVTIVNGVPNYFKGSRGAQPHLIGMNDGKPGWLKRMSLGYIFYLCGEDCFVRYAGGAATLEDLERQAENNLRRGFAVVGLMEEVDLFYEMLTARIGYLNTSLNPNVKGSKHESRRDPQISRCRKLFATESFRKTLLDASPELAALVRLYHVAREVNRVQLEELRSCSSLPLGRNIDD